MIFFHIYKLGVHYTKPLDIICLEELLYNDYKYVILLHQY